MKSRGENLIKKILSIISIASVIICCSGCVSAEADGSAGLQVISDTDVRNEKVLKTGRYYLENGDTEQLQLVLDDFKATDELRDSCTYYQITKVGGYIMPKPVPDELPDGGWTLGHPNENTLEYTKDRLYIYSEK